ncbi:hypothetical protein PIB30_111812, partial [Stylosanthes scabra]|nr:hypothetical protein [Stylosanthes scabra]
TAEDDATSVKTTIENPLIIQQCLERLVKKNPWLFRESQRRQSRRRGIWQTRVNT